MWQNPSEWTYEISLKKHLKIKIIDLRNSGDTAGRNDLNRGVRYGVYVIE